MAITLDDAARNNFLDNGARTAYTGATVQLYDGAGGTGNALLGTPVTVTALTVPAAGTASLSTQTDGVGGAAAGAGVTAVSYVVTLTGGGTETGSVSTTADGTGDMTIDDTSIKQNGTVTLSTFSVTQPGSAT